MRWTENVARWHDLEGEQCLERLRAVCDLVDDAVMAIKKSQHLFDPMEFAGLGKEQAKLLERHLEIAYREILQIKADSRGDTLH